MTSGHDIDSLLHPRARGGAVSQGGFDYQKAAVLVKLCQWLGRDDFQSMVQEGIGDVEGKFFIPGHGASREIVEVKNHQLSPKEFWHEIDHFLHLDKASPGTYQWFTLVVPTLGGRLETLQNTLRRVRGPYGFYEGTSIADASFDQYAQMVAKLGGRHELAVFLFEKVHIDTDLGPLSEHGQAVVQHALTTYLPEFSNLTSLEQRLVVQDASQLLNDKREQEITRQELEVQFRRGLPEERKPPVPPIRIHAAVEIPEARDTGGLLLEWNDFFGGTCRRYPPTIEWNTRLLGELLDLRGWIRQHRTPQNRLRLTGTARLSAWLSLGWVFSAVAGFQLEMEYRGSLWTTDAYPNADTPRYTFDVRWREGNGDILVASVSILRDIQPDVRAHCEQTNINGAPILSMVGCEAIMDARHANRAVQVIKERLTQAIQTSKSKEVLLFFQGPAILALLLGHRLNATAVVQCHEWIGHSGYLPTCVLRP